MAVVNVTATPFSNEKSSHTSLGEWLLAVPRLIVMAIRLLFDSSVPGATRAALAGGLLYIISPIDLIPDVIPVLGSLKMRRWR